MAKRVLTGVKPTHKAHLGNYLGAIQPAIEMSNQEDVSAALFIADYHALTSIHDPKLMTEMTYDLAATWLACGLDPEKTLIYRQSDVPEVFELSWILSCFTTKGLMNRAHAYKAILQTNEEAGRKDADHGVNVGLFTYPVLQAADILIFSADEVPVGEDQIQHIEIARDIAQKFNNTYGEVLKVPEFVVNKSKLVPGIDGRKMSKSYGNHIPMFETSKKVRKTVMKITTDSSAPEDPKDPNDSIIFDIYKLIANPKQITALSDRYKKGLGWGEAKQELFEVIEEHFSEKRQRYEELMSNKEELDQVLKHGAEKVREVAVPFIKEVRKAIGV